MLPAPIPPNETERLAALRALLILDTPPEQRYDKIVQFAAREFDVPTAVISLSDERRQWFKASVGMNACEATRATSFCGHAIMQAEILVVEDALADPRFADNPLVTCAAPVRFYAGAPLLLPSGLALGTLCLIDQVPRRFDAVELAILSTLRDLVVLELAGSGGAGHE